MDYFERAGLRFDVRDSGGSADETVVLLHGFPQQPSAFDEVAALLQEQGLRTLVPSQRGYTETARPRRRRDYRTVDTAEDVLALLDAGMISRAHIVGHDLGGIQAWAFAGWHPERVASLTVLSTPHPSALRASYPVSTQALKMWYVAFFQLPLLPEALAQQTLGTSLRDTRLPLKYVGRYCDAMARPGALRGALNWYRGLPFSRHAPVGPISVPTTYLWGRHDFALGRAAAELTERYVHGPYEFRELDSGHWLPEVEPQAVAEAICERIAA
jgi:pimeloyl-ACP methyl ester carboxylesterase